MAAVLLAAVLVWNEDASTQAVFRSSLMSRDFYEAAFSAVPIRDGEISTEAILVNHHLLAAHLMAQVVSVAATDDEVTVILVSPDHFERGRAPITTIAGEWDTPYGALLPDIDAVMAISSMADIYNFPFVLEHGISNVVPFIKRELPNARLVPVLVKDKAPADMTDKLASQFISLPGRVIVIGSFDFTHEATREQAVINDKRSLDILRDGNISAVGDVAIDSHAGLRLIMQYAKLRDLNFTLLANTNSSYLANKPEQTDVTSYITGFWTR